jgi:hypothetical protein
VAWRLILHRQHHAQIKLCASSRCSMSRITIGGYSAGWRGVCGFAFPPKLAPPSFCVAESIFFSYLPRANAAGRPVLAAAGAGRAASRWQRSIALTLPNAWTGEERQVGRRAGQVPDNGFGVAASGCHFGIGSKPEKRERAGYYAIVAASVCGLNGRCRRGEASGPIKPLTRCN